jgi:D-galactarolactone cycloisomerase
MKSDPRITQIEAFVVRQKLDQPFYFSQWEQHERAVCLVKVTSDSGVVGWGEGYGPAEVVAAGVRFFTPHVIGQNPLYQAAIWQTMYRRSLDYARRGVLLAALSAIDIALWDLKGKLLGQPVATLLGGPRREAVQVYATGMYFRHCVDLPATLAAEAQGYVAQGFRALKMKVGLGIAEDVANVRAVRAAIGPEIQLMMDANHAFARSEAAALARAVEDQQIGWFEEPISPEDYEGYRELRLRTTIPIAGGECEYLCAGFRHLATQQCVDIAQPDLGAAGGLTETQRIAALMQSFGANVTPHCWGTSIVFAAALHFAATLDVLPGRLRQPEPLLEMDRTENSLRDQLTKPVDRPQWQLQNGRVPLPTAPGLGVEVDEARLLAWRTG